MNVPRTSREALMAEVLGELDTLLDRVEALHAPVADASTAISATAKALDAAGERYRTAVTAFNEQAKADLNDYLDLKALQISSAAAQSGAEQIAALQSAAHKAFQSQEFQPNAWIRMAEHLFTALITSTLTATFVLLWLQTHCI